MANLMDYLDWRGDLRLEDAPFNEVDNLILAELSFLQFEGIVPDVGQGESVALKDAVDAWFLRHEGEEVHMGVLVPRQIVPMADKLRRSRRFADMRLDCCRSVLDIHNEVQFAALTIDMGSTGIYVAFRGTDDTLVGWKEDFNMAFLPQIPSQKMAVEYLKEVAARYPRKKIYVGGHSKGGNLTVFAAVFCGARVQRRIAAAYSNDGPGFKEPMVGRAEYEAVRGRIFSIIPQSSVVGMLLEHEEDYTVVDSDQLGFMQHDGFSWQVMGDHFLRLRQVTRQAHLSDQELRAWVHALPVERREQFVEALFNVLSASGAVTLTDLKEDSFKAVGPMVKAMKELDKETREGLLKFVGILFKSNLRMVLEGIQEETEKKAAEIKRRKKKKAET